MMHEPFEKTLSPFTFSGMVKLEAHVQPFTVLSAPIGRPASRIRCDLLRSRALRVRDLAQRMREGLVTWSHLECKRRTKCL